MSSSSMIGPALPPHMRKDEDDSSDASYGPSLPPELIASRSSITDSTLSNDDNDDDDVIGPMPPSSTSSTDSISTIRNDIESRAQRMKDKLEGKTDKQPKRESWMTELPENSKHFGLGPRQFNRKNVELSAKEKDRSVWTKTPQDSGSNKDDTLDQDCLDYLASLERDNEMERASEELKKKRGNESLLEMHSKKLKKFEKSKSQTEERRPFDRDIDLKANRFDNAMKERMVKQSRQLDDKFSRGASKYL